MVRGYNIASLAKSIEPTLVLCSAVVQRAVMDATSRPNRIAGLTPEVIAEARSFLASDDLLVWVSVITPDTRSVEDVAQEIRQHAGIGQRPEQSALPLH